MSRLAGKRVLITGASSGIGAAAAVAFAREGADLALVARSRPGLEATAVRARAEGVGASVVVADLGTREAAEAAVAEAVDVLGGLDVLVWNAASMVFGRFSEVPPEDFDRTMAVTFGGAVHTIRAALPHLERSRGAVVATGSINARLPLASFASYAAAKHALRGFLGSLRIEMLERRTGVSVSMVHPGPVDTPLWHNVSSATGLEPRNPPLPYSPETIADALVALAIRPRAEITVGAAEGRLLELVFAVARPVADRALALVNRYYNTGREPVPGRGGLWEPQGTGRADGGLHGRPSAWVAVRLRRSGARQRSRAAAPGPVRAASAGDGAVSVTRGAGVAESGAPVQRTVSPP